MKNEKFTMPSGASLEIQMAPFDDSMALQDAILRAFKGVPLAQLKDLDYDPANPASVFAKNSEDVLAKLMDRIISIATSPEVKDALWKCFGRAVYDGQKLNRDLFDSDKYRDSLRQDYYVICFRVAEVNCKPFFLPALSKFKSLAQTKANTQKQPLQPTVH